MHATATAAHDHAVVTAIGTGDQRERGTAAPRPRRLTPAGTHHGGLLMARTPPSPRGLRCSTGQERDRQTRRDSTMGLRSWVREHRGRERAMREQGFLLMDRIMGHLAVPSAAEQEAEYTRLYTGAIRAGQTQRDDWTDLAVVERERRAQGWTGQSAEIPPVHFADLAAAREELWHAEAAERGTPAWRHRAHERAMDRVARGVEALERAERVLGMRGWTDGSEHRLRVGEIGPTHLPPARTPEEAEEQAFQGLFHGAVRAGQILYGEKTYRELTDIDALETMAQERRMAGWTGDQAEVAPPGLGKAAAAREDLWSAMHAAQRAAERGVLHTGVDAHRQAVDGVLRAVEAVERAEGRGAYEDTAPGAPAQKQEMGMPTSTPPPELEKAQALTPEAAAEMRRAVEEVPDPLENLPRGEEEKAQRAEELEHQLTEAESPLGTELRQFDDTNLDQARVELDALYQRMGDEKPGLDEAHQHNPRPWYLVPFRPDETPFEGLDEEAEAAQIEHLRAEEAQYEQEGEETAFVRADVAQGAAQLALTGRAEVDEELGGEAPEPAVSATRPDAEPETQLETEGAGGARMRLRDWLQQQRDHHEQLGLHMDEADRKYPWHERMVVHVNGALWEHLGDEQEAAENLGRGLREMDFTPEPVSRGMTPEQELRAGPEEHRPEDDPTPTADAEFFADFPSPDGTAAAPQIVDDVETDLDRDGANTSADLTDGMVHGADVGEPVNELEEEPTSAVDRSDQLSAEHDDIGREDESGLDSQADRLARTRLEADSEPSYASHTELDHAHEAEMDW
jgi:hypothetical protein